MRSGSRDPSRSEDGQICAAFFDTVCFGRHHGAGFGLFFILFFELSLTSAEVLDGRGIKWTIPWRFWIALARNDFSYIGRMLGVSSRMREDTGVLIISSTTLGIVCPFDEMKHISFMNVAIPTYIIYLRDKRNHPSLKPTLTVSRAHKLSSPPPRNHQRPLDPVRSRQSSSVPLLHSCP